MPLGADIEDVRAALMELARRNMIPRRLPRGAGEGGRLGSDLVSVVVEENAPWDLGPVNAVHFGRVEGSEGEGVAARVDTKYVRAREGTKGEWWSDFDSIEDQRRVWKKLCKSGEDDVVLVAILTSKAPAPSCPLCRSSLTLYIHLVAPTLSLSKGRDGTAVHERVWTLWKTRLGPRSLVGKVGAHLVIGGFLRMVGAQ